MTVFGESGLNFRDYFRTIQTEFSGLFSDSPDMIFRTIFDQSRTVLRFGFDPETDVFGFCGVFWWDQEVPCFIRVRDLGDFVCYYWKIK